VFRGKKIISEERLSLRAKFYQDETDLAVSRVADGWDSHPYPTDYGLRATFMLQRRNRTKNGT